MIAPETRLRIGTLLFDGLDQMDATGPFEVFARIPNATCRFYAKSLEPVTDARGLRLSPDARLGQAPQLDVLHVPGGYGQEALMEDASTLEWIASQAAGAKYVFSVCTGALICGAAGLLNGRRATTHWSAFALLSFFGAVPVDERVVVDGRLISTAGVSAGIDGALRLAAMLRGDEAAQTIQLYMQYAPRPPFDAGTPETAPPAVLAAVRSAGQALAARREAAARRIGARLGLRAAGLDG